MSGELIGGRMVYGATNRRRAREQERRAERDRLRETYGEDVIVREVLIPIPSDIVVVFDAAGWRAEMWPTDLDLEALCDAQDAEDAEDAVRFAS